MLAMLPAWSCWGVGRSRGGGRLDLVGLDRTLGRLVGPDQVGGQLGSAEHVPHRGLGLTREQLIERPQLRIQALPAAL